MSTYDDTFRQEVVDIFDEVLTDAQAAGLLPRENAVRLATVTTTGRDDAAGEPGTETVAYTAIEPRPSVQVKDQWRWRDNAQVKTGDALLKVLRTPGTKEALLAAAFVEVGGATAGTGTRYTLVQGEMRESAYFLFVTLERMR